METEVPKGHISKKYWRAKEAAGLDFLTASYAPAPVDCHFHHGFTISAVEMGVLPLVVRDLHIDLHPGEVLLLGPEVPHSFDIARATSGCRYRTLTRALYNLAPWLERALARELNSICRISDRSLSDAFLGSLRSVESGERRDVHLLHELSRGLLSDISKNTLFRFDVRSPNIRAVKAYLDANYARVPDIRELSDVGGLSPRHFIRLFKEEFGMTSHHYLNQLRINKAREMLGMGDSMLRIAYDLGFSDQSHFSKTFSKITGVSPARYLAGVGTDG